MRRWFPRGWWSAAGLLVIVAIASAPVWLWFALDGDFGERAGKAARWGLTGLFGLFVLNAVVMAVGKVVEEASEARREAKTAGWGRRVRSVLRGVLRVAAAVVGVMLAVGAFQEVASAFDRVDHWFWGWPAEEGLVWGAVWVGGRLAWIGAFFGVLALGIGAVVWVLRRFENLAAWKRDRVLDWLGVLALAGVGWLAWRNPFGVAAASIGLGVVLLIGWAISESER
jgi:hypothetical protein